MRIFGLLRNFIVVIEVLKCASKLILVNILRVYIESMESITELDALT